MYLRPAGDKETIRDALATTMPNDDNVEELIDVALYEAVDAERGFAWLLGHNGTCNAITSFEGLAANLPVADQRECAAILVRHLHAELLANVWAHIEQREENVPKGDTLLGLISERPWLFQNDSYHVDTSHLAATVRFGIA